MSFPLLIDLPYLKVGSMHNVCHGRWPPLFSLRKDPKFRAGHRIDNGESKLDALGSMSSFYQQMRYNGQSQRIYPPSRFATNMT